MRGLFGSFVRPRARPCARHTRVFKILSAPRVLTYGALCAAGQTAGAAGCACFPSRFIFQNPIRPDARGELPAPGHASGMRGLLGSFVRPCARPCVRYARAFLEFCPPVRPAMRPAYESFQNFIRPARPDVRGALRCGARRAWRPAHVFRPVSFFRTPYVLTRGTSCVPLDRYPNGVYNAGMADTPMGYPARDARNGPAHGTPGAARGMQTNGRVPAQRAG